MKIFYKNSSGKVLDFMQWPYKISDSEILGYEWSYTGTENTGNKSGGSLSSIRKKIGKTTLTLAVSARTKEAYTPVSYTHLDVYKRQMQMRAGEART